MMTFTWANDAAGKATMATAATMVVMDARQLLHMAFDSSVETRLAPILCDRSRVAPRHLAISER